MNIMFIFSVCFGVVVLAIAIASSLFNANADAGKHAAPWMRRVRLFQNDKENTGWRIQMIPYDNPNQPKTVNFRNGRVIRFGELKRFHMRMLRRAVLYHFYRLLARLDSLSVFRCSF
jgi:hypothetical protein